MSMGIIITAIIIQYVFCSVLIYGMLNGHTYLASGDVYEPRQDRGFCIFIGLFFGLVSVIGVLCTFLITGFAEGGFKW